jgi:hypothetical protein
LAPSIVGGKGAGRLRLEATYSGDYRGSEPAGHTYVQELALSAAITRLGPLSAEVTLLGGRIDASRFADDRQHLLGGEVATRVALGPWMRALASYHVEMRVPFDDADRGRRVLQDATLRLPVSWSSRVELGPFGDYLRLHAIEAGGDDPFARLRGGVAAGLYLGGVSAALSGFVGRATGAGLTPSVQAGGGAHARLRLVDWLDACVTGELTRATNGPGPLDRGLLLFGLVAHTSTRPRVERAETDDDLRPLLEPADTARPARARLRLVAPSATSVAVVGSWDDWAAPRLLERKPRGLWEIWLPLSPGQHRYHFLVDGRLVSPPRAMRYAADGFGGQDGVLEIPAESPRIP